MNIHEYFKVILLSTTSVRENLLKTNIPILLGTDIVPLTSLNKLRCRCNDIRSVQITVTVKSKAVFIYTFYCCDHRNQVCSDIKSINLTAETRSVHLLLPSAVTVETSGTVSPCSRILQVKIVETCVVF